MLIKKLTNLKHLILLLSLLSLLVTPFMSVPRLSALSAILSASAIPIRGLSVPFTSSIAFSVCVCCLCFACFVCVLWLICYLYLVRSNYVFCGPSAFLSAIPEPGLSALSAFSVSCFVYIFCDSFTVLVPGLSTLFAYSVAYFLCVFGGLSTVCVSSASFIARLLYLCLIRVFCSLSTMPVPCLYFCSLSAILVPCPCFYG